MIRDFRLRAARELGPLGENLRAVAEDWVRDWLGHGPAPIVAVVRSERGPGEDAEREPDWQRGWSSSGAPELWCAARFEAGRGLTAALFGTPEPAAPQPEEGIAGDVTGSALADFARRCLRRPDGEGAPLAPTSPPLPPPDAWAPGFGACEVRVEVCGSRLRCLLSPAAVDAWLEGAAAPPRSVAPVVRRSDALSGQRVRARGVIGEAELPVEALAAFSVGDVVSLDQRVDEPSKLVFPELEIACNAYLCEQGGRNALLLDQRASPDGALQPARETTSESTS